MRIGWLLYAVVIGSLWIGSYWQALTNDFHESYIIDLLIKTTGFIGLIAFASKARVGRKAFWALFFYVFLAWDAVFNLVLTSEAPATYGMLPTILFMALFFGPQYAALWLYGNKSPDIWVSGNEVLDA